MLLKKIGANVGRVRGMVESELKRLPTGSTGGQMILPDPGFSQVILDAQNRADTMGDEYLSAEHLLMSLAEIDSDAKQILSVNSIRGSTIEQALKDIRGGEKVHQRQPRGAVQGIGAIRDRFAGYGPAGQARPGDRAGGAKFAGACRCSTGGRRTIRC